MAFETLTAAQVEAAIAAIQSGAQSYTTPAGSVTAADLRTLLELHQKIQASKPRRLVARTVLEDW